MNWKSGYFMVLLMILISFILLNVSFAADNSTEFNCSSDDVISLENENFIDNELNIEETDNGSSFVDEVDNGGDVESVIDDECVDGDKLESINDNLFDLSPEDILGTYIPYCGVNIENPDFEDGFNGWNYTSGASIIGARVHNGAKSLRIEVNSTISQYINFNVIDAINVWSYGYSYVGSGVNVKVYNENVIKFYSDEELLLQTVIPGFNYINCSIDVSEVTGWHNFKIVTGEFPEGAGSGVYWFQFDDISVVRNDVIDPYFSVDSINVVDGNISVKFVDHSFGWISSWLWDFGDGSISTDKNPVHVYSEPGVYTVTQTISDGNQFVENTQVINVKDIFSVDFAVDANVSFKNLTVNFTDLSSGDINGWLWDFGDGNTSFEQNPVHTYSGDGNYNVTLTVFNEVKSLNVTKVNLIHLYDDLVPDFTCTADDGTYSFVVWFSDSSSGNPDSWLWDFGDGNISCDKNPIHRYGAVGDYNVTLTVSSRFNTTNLTKSISVRAKESSIRITDISKKLLVSGILKNQDGILSNEKIYYQMNGNVGFVVSDGDGKFAVQGIPNTSLVLTFNGSNDTCSYESAVELGDLMTKNTVVGVSSPYKMVAVDYNVGEKGKYFTFYLKDVDGNPLPYMSLKVKVGSSSYDVFTDVGGKVSLLTKYVKAGTYTWVISFEGDDDYNSVSKTVKIVVSKKSMKITPKKTSYTFKKTAKTKYVKATLKTSNKYLKTGKKVILTIKGKKYTVKAGKKGAITFNIASFKKKGTYKVKIKFAGDSTYKSCASKIIKIKIK